jgi:hypothetical protein
MNKLGDIKSGKELGYKTSHNYYIWASCEICLKERWVQVLKGKPQWSHCIECGKNIRKHNKPHIITEEQRHPLTKRCNKCGIIYPATKEYFHTNNKCYSGLVSPCRNCSNKKLREHYLEIGKIKSHRLTLEQLKAKHEKEELKLEELRLNQPIGVLGEIKYGKAIGLKDNFKHQWLACESCGIERWVRLTKGLPQNLLCRNCGAKAGKEKLKGRTYIHPKTQKVIDTGLKECTKCHKLLPANTEFFVKSKLKLGIGAVCRDCQSKIYKEKRESLGLVENICSVCGRKRLIYNTGKQKDICTHCSGKLGGKQKLPRSTKGKEHKFIPKEKSTCRMCKVEYPAILKYFRRNKATKSGLYLGKCRKCLNKIRHKRINSNPKLKMNSRISLAINLSLHGNKYYRHWENLVNYTVEDLMEHLEKQFTDGMGWNNYGRSINGEKRWEIDHIIPKCAFAFTSPDDLGFKQCWALSNLQPLWAEDNNKKNGKIPKDFKATVNFTTNKNKRAIH